MLSQVFVTCIIVAHGWSQPYNQS